MAPYVPPQKGMYIRLTILDFDNPLVSLPNLYTSDGREGRKHGMESLESSIIWKSNTDVVGLAELLKFPHEKRDCGLQSVGEEMKWCFLVWAGS